MNITKPVDPLNLSAIREWNACACFGKLVILAMYLCALALISVRAAQSYICYLCFLSSHNEQYTIGNLAFENQILTLESSISSTFCLIVVRFSMFMMNPRWSMFSTSLSLSRIYRLCACPFSRICVFSCIS